MPLLAFFPLLCLNWHSLTSFEFAHSKINSQTWATQVRIWSTYLASLAYTCYPRGCTVNVEHSILVPHDVEHVMLSTWYILDTYIWPVWDVDVVMAMASRCTNFSVVTVWMAWSNKGLFLSTGMCKFCFDPVQVKFEKCIFWDISFRLVSLT